jgi:hypothetical protein
MVSLKISVFNKYVPLENERVREGDMRDIHSVSGSSEREEAALFSFFALQLLGLSTAERTGSPVFHTL